MPHQQLQDADAMPRVNEKALTPMTPQANNNERDAKDEQRSLNASEALP